MQKMLEWSKMRTDLVGTGYTCFQASKEGCNVFDTHHFPAQQVLDLQLTFQSLLFGEGDGHVGCVEQETQVVDLLGWCELGLLPVDGDSSTFQLCYNFCCCSNGLFLGVCDD